MAGIKHPKVLPGTDDSDPNTASPSDWNAEHTGLQWFGLAADIANSTTTLADITGFTWSLTATEGCSFTAHIFHVAAALTTGITLGLTGPASPAMYRAALMSGTGATTFQTIGVTGTAYSSMSTTAVWSITLPNLTIWTGHIKNGTTAGTIQLRFAAEVAAAMTLQQGSYVTVVRF